MDVSILYLSFICFSLTLGNRMHGLIIGIPCTIKYIILNSLNCITRLFLNLIILKIHKCYLCTGKSSSKFEPLNYIYRLSYIEAGLREKHLLTKKKGENYKIEKDKEIKISLFFSNDQLRGILLRNRIYFIVNHF